ncbi:omega-amidase NIT2 [Thecamonas trahens ATCC 50062]|uniref:Omega-amidase NIT2 n=1 Tax=Thecamonas trahens ATCC 50062 TaxID=461836 RepID=A0A0L0D5L6_THETB|nr:omega-amidase NIT2 [Thecamonas trahens ATCC 50062]KNC47634.1 omega-amidase NIT2 [Thecamonas trahens ATCC 50062]|eukprot:XP_013759554.1 omega-amidase NIT2 [Thecamonas trahens ATCC 50062]
MAVGADKTENLATAAEAVRSAAAAGADMVVLPECFNSPYGTGFFPDYAEILAPGAPGGTYDALAAMAADSRVTLFAGSVPESAAVHPDADDDAVAGTDAGDARLLYNTALVFGADGSELARHRKVHLFDIDVPGKIRFIESETLSPGDTVTVVETPQCKVGLAICYDVRFPEMAAIAADAGAELLVYPGAFNLVTGPLHWELLLRSRAVDNQLFVAGVSPARDESADYVAWGHSTLVDPWGKVLGALEAAPGTIVLDIDLAAVDDVRASIPIRTQRRPEVYAAGRAAIA